MSIAAFGHLAFVLWLAYEYDPNSIFPEPCLPVLICMVVMISTCILTFDNTTAAWVTVTMEENVVTEYLVSVVVITYNRASGLRNALESLLRQRTPEWLRYEIVVVDDGSSDSTSQVVCEPACEHRGYYLILLPYNWPGGARGEAPELPGGGMDG